LFVIAWQEEVVGVFVTVFVRRFNHNAVFTAVIVRISSSCRFLRSAADLICSVALALVIELSVSQRNVRVLLRFPYQKRPRNLH
jgi:hypothetical protein